MLQNTLPFGFSARYTKDAHTVMLESGAYLHFIKSFLLANYKGCRRGDGAARKQCSRPTSISFCFLLFSKTFSATDIQFACNLKVIFPVKIKVTGLLIAVQPLAPPACPAPAKSRGTLPTEIINHGSAGILSASLSSHVPRLIFFLDSPRNAH